jgi:hypothetical protein
VYPDHVPDFRIHHQLVYTKYQEYACYVTYDVSHFATHHKSEYTKYQNIHIPDSGYTTNQDTTNIRIYMYQILGYNKGTLICGVS